MYITNDQTPLYIVGVSYSWYNSIQGTKSYDSLITQPLLDMCRDLCNDFQPIRIFGPLLLVWQISFDLFGLDSVRSRGYEPDDAI